MEIRQRFNVVGRIGKGSFGVFYKAKDNQLKRVVAIKKQIFENPKKGIPSTALREI